MKFKMDIEFESRVKVPSTDSNTIDILIKITPYIPQKSFI